MRPCSAARSVHKANDIAIEDRKFGEVTPFQAVISLRSLRVTMFSKDLLPFRGEIHFEKSRNEIVNLIN